MKSSPPPLPTGFEPPVGAPQRRSFLASLGALIAGGLATLAPLGAGLAAFVTPLFRKNASQEIRVALLEQVPDDGLPHYFPVIAERRDAWTRYPQQRIGAVYLVREPGAQTPLALTAICPHAGCFIGYASGDDHFRCPCHTSVFRLDGARSRGDQEVAPRDMDRLKVVPKKATTPDGSQVIEVWVEYVNFETGRKEAAPIA